MSAVDALRSRVNPIALALALVPLDETAVFVGLASVPSALAPRQLRLRLRPWSVCVFPDLTPAPAPAPSTTSENAIRDGTRGLYSDTLLVICAAAAPVVVLARNPPLLPSHSGTPSLYGLVGVPNRDSRSLSARFLVVANLPERLLLARSSSFSSSSALALRPRREAGPTGEVGVLPVLEPGTRYVADADPARSMPSRFPVRGCLRRAVGLGSCTLMLLFRVLSASGGGGGFDRCCSTPLSSTSPPNLDWAPSGLPFRSLDDGRCAGVDPSSNAETDRLCWITLRASSEPLLRVVEGRPVPRLVRADGGFAPARSPRGDGILDWDGVGVGVGRGLGLGEDEATTTTTGAVVDVGDGSVEVDDEEARARRNACGLNGDASVEVVVVSSPVFLEILGIRE